MLFSEKTLVPWLAASAVPQKNFTLSLEVARSQARMLLDWLEDLGNGAAAAAKRREWAEVEERRMGGGEACLPALQSSACPRGTTSGGVANSS
jgi:hypothetical protein